MSSRERPVPGAPFERERADRDGAAPRAGARPVRGARELPPDGGGGNRPRSCPPTSRDAAPACDAAGPGARATSFLAEAADTTAPPARPTARAPDWRTWLAGSPREILRRAVAGDPLGVRALVARHLREAALLLDGDRVHLRALARCARRAPSYRGRPPIERWLGSHVATAAEELARDAGDPSAQGGASAIHDLARPLGLEPAAMQRACAAFHRLPAADRHAFFALVIDQRSLDEIARAASASASEIARRARRALDTLLEGALARERHPPPHSIEGGTRDSPRT